LGIPKTLLALIAPHHTWYPLGRDGDLCRWPNYE
jgi:hypothetical protein